jgi:hypothetical protein
MIGGTHGDIHDRLICGQCHGGGCKQGQSGETKLHEISPSKHRANPGVMQEIRVGDPAGSAASRSRDAA